MSYIASITLEIIHNRTLRDVTLYFQLSIR